MTRLSGSIRLALLTLVIMVLAGCTLPPDIAPAPTPGPPPAFERDASLSGKPPLESLLMEQAWSDPDAAGVVLLETGDDALLARIHLIRAARESIDIQTFIWVQDRSGGWIFRELVEAARRGVQVRVLIDHFVQPGVDAADYAAMVTAHENLEVRLFRPLSGDAINSEWSVARNTFARFETLNTRMHNKVLLVDGRAAIVGGRNYQDAYFDRDPRLNFRDRDVLVFGPACNDMAAFFSIFWEDRESFEASRMDDLRHALDSGKAQAHAFMDTPLDPVFGQVDQSANLYDLGEAGESLRLWKVDAIEFLSDTPDDMREWRKPWRPQPFENLMETILAAEQEVLIETPYAIMGKRSKRLVKKLNKKEPAVRIRVSTNSLSSSDHLYVGAIALKQRRLQVKDLGMELYLAKPVPGDIRTLVPRYDSLLQESANELNPDWEADMDIIPLDIEGPRFCVHGKSVVIDRRVAFVGSHNFDPRSFNLNTECGVLIRDTTFASHLATTMERAMHPGNSWVVAPRRFPPVMNELNSLITMVSSSLPMFDLWPLEHVSCYELKEGKEPLSPYDPDFQWHYEDVGPIPGMDLGIREIQARLVRSFAGMAAPFM
jgi:phosphatidylserine/phosphatidylglycerophosphate/cardiolipin synthase-like enzyme